jgi:hypothetical protein
MKTKREDAAKHILGVLARIATHLLEAVDDNAIKSTTAKTGLEAMQYAQAADTAAHALLKFKEGIAPLELTFTSSIYSKKNKP